MQSGLFAIALYLIIYKARLLLSYILLNELVKKFSVEEKKNLKFNIAIFAKVENYRLVVMILLQEGNRYFGIGRLA